MVNQYCKPGNIICEIGVFTGDFANILLQTTPSKLVLIDPWDGMCPSGNADGNNVIQVNLAEVYGFLLNHVKNIPVIEMKRDYSYNVLPTYPDKYFDCIYIDGDHSYTGCKIDLELSIRKIKPGGYIMGHDYEMNFEKAKNNYNFGVKQAVDEFCETYGLSICAKGMDGCVSYAIHVPNHFYLYK
jgi:hypothetical protein